MGRAPCCDKANVKKGPWSPEEDAKLKDFINKHGTGGNWIALPHKAGLKRCGKSCRLRWLNYLRPNIKHGEFSEDEDRIICSLYANIGSRWSIIAGQLPGRTDNDIKNYWNTKLRKKLLAMLPSFQKKPSLNFPSISPPFSDHHKSDNYNFNPNNSSSFFNYNNPNFIINNINSHLTTTTSTTLIHDHINVTDLFSPPTTTTSNPNVNGVISNNNYNYLGFQDEYYYYYPEVKERMLMFGGGDPHHQIKQEEEFGVQGFEDQVHSLIMTDDEHKGYFKNHVIDVSPLHSDIEEVKQVIDMNNNNSSSASMINVNINSYMHADE